MQKLLLLILAVCSMTTSNAQEWMKNINQEKPNFHEIKEAFNNYWKEKPIEKGRGYKPFKRWEWYWEQRVGISGEFPPTDVLWTELEKYNQSHANNKTVSSSTANWSFYGPSSSAGGYSGIGRVNCIGFHPTNANTFWVGTPAGGLWKTTDGGTTWTTNTDNLPVLGVSDIAINPSNANIIYIATGDGEAATSLNNGFGDTKSVGVLKSTNGGTTWNTTGLSWSQTNQKLIRRLIINPSNPLILIAATSDGIYRTSNGGTSWTQQQTGWFTDVEFKPSDPNYVYASTYNASGGAQIFTSTNGGVSWTQVTSLSGVIRINLAVTANSPNLVDAVCVNTSSGLSGLYYSANSGASFTQYYNASCSNNLLNNSFDASGCDGQGYYDLAYAINPSDVNDIRLGGVNTWRTSDGGSTWYLNNMWSPNASQNPNGVPVVHADKHFIAFHPLNNAFVYECNDGGLYVTNDNGTTWYDLTNGMGISQIYRIGTNAQLSNDVICGLQDNGTKELYSGSWIDQQGGDGMECIIDYTNGNIMYATYVQGQISKTTNGGTSWNVILQNNGSAGTADEAGEWVTPYIMHPTNNNILLVGKSQVYQTTNGGTSWSQLGTISGITGNILSMAYAPSNPQTIYVATQYQIFKTTNGGGSWSLIGTSTDAITYIAISPTNPQYVYLTLSGYTAGNKVNMSPDGGATWYNYSGTLPNIPVNCIVYQNGSNEGLYIGTDLGVYYTDGTLSDWVAYNTGLPNVVVNELEISYIDNKLWAATFGRGLWKSDLNSISTGLSNNSTEKNNILVYPNPSEGLFEIKFNGINSNSNSLSIQVTDILGRTVYQLLDHESNNLPIKIDLSNQENGIYNVILRNGDKRYVNKVVVNK